MDIIKEEEKLLLSMNNLKKPFTFSQKKITLKPIRIVGKIGLNFYLSICSRKPYLNSSQSTENCLETKLERRKREKAAQRVVNKNGLSTRGMPQKICKNRLKKKKKNLH